MRIVLGLLVTSSLVLLAIAVLKTNNEGLEDFEYDYEAEQDEEEELTGIEGEEEDLTGIEGEEEDLTGIEGEEEDLTGIEDEEEDLTGIEDRLLEYEEEASNLDDHLRIEEEEVITDGEENIDETENNDNDASEESFKSEELHAEIKAVSGGYKEDWDELVENNKTGHQQGFASLYNIREQINYVQNWYNDLIQSYVGENIEDDKSEEDEGGLDGRAYNEGYNQDKEHKDTWEKVNRKYEDENRFGNTNYDEDDKRETQNLRKRQVLRKVGRADYYEDSGTNEVDHREGFNRDVERSGREIGRSRGEKINRRQFENNPQREESGLDYRRSSEINREYGQRNKRENELKGNERQKSRNDDVRDLDGWNRESSRRYFEPKEDVRELDDWNRGSGPRNVEAGDDVRDVDGWNKESSRRYVEPEEDVRELDDWNRGSGPRNVEAGDDVRDVDEFNQGNSKRRNGNPGYDERGNSGENRNNRYKQNPAYQLTPTIVVQCLAEFNCIFSEDLRWRDRPASQNKVLPEQEEGSAKSEPVIVVQCLSKNSCVFH